MTETDLRPSELPDQPKPENAKQAVAMVRDDARWVLARPDLNSTDGIKRNIEALWAAINRLAEYVDGGSTQTPAYQAPKTQTERNGNHNTTKRS